MSDSCIFCKIASGEIPARRLYEDDLVVAFEDLSPQAPTHLLVIPRRHLASLLDAKADDEALLGRLQRVAARLARERGHDHGGFRVVTNTLGDAGQSVFHLHVHVLGGRRFAWPPG